MSKDISTIRINGQRLWGSLMEMAKFGATPKGGCNRQTLTDDDKRGRDQFIDWCESANCSITIDAMGNIFARRPGQDNELAPVIIGSHLDTQPTGGKFDGVYGVLAGLEVIRTLNDHSVETKCPLEVVTWTNEEGARFSPAMIGSGVWAGVFDLDYAYSRKDKNGKALGGELKRIGYLGDIPARPKPITAAFELHIEQGPILEMEDLQIGIVSGVQGIRWYDLIIDGKACHAGPTPMNGRQDPFMGIYKIIDRLYQLIDQHGPLARITFGDIKAEPGSRNTVPERLVMTIDIRHPEASILDELDASLKKIVLEETEKLKLVGTVKDEWASAPVQFDKNCITAVTKAVEILDYSHKEMFSGAGHDSVYISHVAPTSMIFIPCEGGLSHNEAENVKPEDIEAGANVLLHAMLLSQE